MTSRLPQCFLCTDDPDLERTVNAHIRYLADIRSVNEAGELLLLLGQFDPALLMLDLRTAVARDHLPAVFQDYPDALVLAFGTERSVPALSAEAMGAYAVVDPAIERQRLQTLVRHALEHLRLVEHNRLLKIQVSRLNPPFTADAAVWPPTPTASELFAQAFRFFDNPDMMFDTMAHGIIAGAKVARVAIFAYSDKKNVYRYRCGVNALQHTVDADIGPDAPFVCHLRLHAHVICRTRLDAIPDPDAAAAFKQMLDMMGAEIIVPMQAHHSLIGWLAVGHHITGMPFSQRDIENLVPLTDQVAVALSNQLLFARTSMQKALAESVFHAMPIGVVAIDLQGNIHWINRTGAMLFGVEPEAVIRQPASRLSSRLCDLLLRCIQLEDAPQSVEWSAPPSGPPLQISLRRMTSDGCCVGALAVLRDITQERAFRQKEAELERRSFWTGMAAAMSHEIRNPLVAISTFAQLLPERYTDPEFREEFSQLVSQEVGRLNGIVNQISDFAEHRLPVLQPLAIDAVLEKAVQAVIPDFPEAAGRIALPSAPLPLVQGDDSALETAFAYILRNALEATDGQPDAQLKVTASIQGGGDQRKTLQLVFSDNGPGIPESLRTDLFSPFCTTKARGIGVGLSVARRTVIDHGGTITIPPLERGARIEITLPVNHETA